MSQYSGYSGYGSSDEEDTPPMERKTVSEGDGETRPRPGDICKIYHGRTYHAMHNHEE